MVGQRSRAKQGVGGRQRWGKRDGKTEWKTEGGRQMGGCSRASRHGVRICVCVCVSWEGTVGGLGAWRKGSELWGQLCREQRGWGKGMGEGRQRVRGMWSVFEFENLRGEATIEGRK